MTEPRASRTLVSVGALGTIALTLDATGRARWLQLSSEVTGRPEWMELGTGRMRMWTDSLMGFSKEGPLAWVWGTGIEGFVRFWKPLHPHSEVLFVTYQLGLLGLCVLISLAVLQLRSGCTRSRFFGWAALVHGLITGGLVALPTASWLAWAVIAALVVPDATRSEALRVTPQTTKRAPRE